MIYYRREIVKLLSKNQLKFDFEKLISTINRNGDIKTVKFQPVYLNMMKVQQDRIKEICGNRFNKIEENGSLISILIAYTREEIQFINQLKPNGLKDTEQWNKYASAYYLMNDQLNKIAEKIARKVEGIPILATLEGIAGKVTHVSAYFPQTVSHRHIAELAGIGWRGKNQLIIHPRFSCAIRFASIITPHQYEIDNNIDKNSCEDCRACLDVCKFLDKQSILKDYREQCRRYINHLNLNADVCGKCIKACVNHSKFSSKFHLN